MGKSKKSGNATKNVAIGAAFAAAVGFVAGILTAPKSGKETRGDIKAKATETYAAAETELKKLHVELDDIIAEGTERISSLRGKGQISLDEAVEKGKTAKLKATAVLESLQSGEAEDKDLQKAIVEATKAIENLRTYLKK